MEELLYKFEFDDTQVIDVCEWGNYCCYPANKILIDTIQGGRNYFKYIHLNTDKIDEYLSQNKLN